MTFLKTLYGRRSVQYAGLLVSVVLLSGAGFLSLGCDYAPTPDPYHFEDKTQRSKYGAAIVTQEKPEVKVNLQKEQKYLTGEVRPIKWSSTGFYAAPPDYFSTPFSQQLLPANQLVASYPEGIPPGSRVQYVLTGHIESISGGPDRIIEYSVPVIKE